MTFSLLNTALLASIEFSINKVIALDSTSLTKLKALSGSVIALKISSPEYHFYISIQAQSIQLMSHFEGKPEASINGSASALLALMASPNSSQSLHANDIQLSGDLELVQNLQRLVTNINIDWEYYLSQFIGDIPTQEISDGLASLSSQIKSNGDSLYMNIEDYLQEESQLFPNSIEFESFSSSIDELTLQMDRAEARMNNLSKSVASKN